MSNEERRIALHEKLVAVLGDSHVYFQPPESIKLTYPCIVYTLGSIDSNHADNKVYGQCKSYEITVITTDPDSDLPERMACMPLCRHNRHFVSDNLYHDVYTMYY